MIGGVLLVILGALVSAKVDLESAKASSLYTFFHQKLDCEVQDDRVTLHETQLFIFNMDPAELIEWEEFYAHFSSMVVDADTPQEIHLAMTNDRTQMLVAWAQKTPSNDALVRYGVSSGSYPASAVAMAHNYSVHQGHVEWQSMQLFEGLLTELQPSTRYYYICGSPQGGWSSEYSFLSAPASVPERVSWGMYGDMGTIAFMGWDVTKMLVAENAKDPLDLILHVGDIAYAGVSSQSEGEVEPIWDAFMNQIQPLAAVMPYQVTVGNHEAYYNYTSFSNRFDMPGAQSQGWGNFWWSFDYANVHVTAMSTEHDYCAGSPQFTFLENDLMAAREANADWLIVGAHRPFYSSDQDEWNSHSPGCQLLTCLEALFNNYKVDLVMTGHMHCYERTYPVNNGTVIDSHPGQSVFVNPAAPIYIVQGTAGAFIWEKWVDPQPNWSANRQQHYGFGRMDVYTAQNGTTSLNLKYLSNGVVLDDLWIQKP